MTFWTRRVIPCSRHVVRCLKDFLPYLALGSKSGSIEVIASSTGARLTFTCCLPSATFLAWFSIPAFSSSLQHWVRMTIISLEVRGKIRLRCSNYSKKFFGFSECEPNCSLHWVKSCIKKGTWICIAPPPHLVSLSTSVQFSRSVVSDYLQPHESQHARPPCPSPTPGVHSDSRPSSQWCHQAISSSVVPFSSCPQSLPASESFPMSQLFTWGGQSISIKLKK